LDFGECEFYVNFFAHFAQQTVSPGRSVGWRLGKVSRILCTRGQLILLSLEEKLHKRRVRALEAREQSAFLFVAQESLAKKGQYSGFGVSAIWCAGVLGEVRQGRRFDSKGSMGA